ncbi:hypothetical protein [Nostoc sp. 'Peltigera membranacea cyanobiont' N6]|uniref:hypothetical protein n=1 Tax=Nostoc sp. 'Peltigera membranacea cyanobiont' N6 TaxID=1261031 RepID=UPI000CF32711|nr:hypothetical protein [Nostoc sp. 'Peltigera membranacea cyanobiont' N6]AVH67049.1 hypothetical protein NPM_5618 [Nostoc sp. 'Peltigera membranacea cyanobiont' N6]
MSKSYIIRKFRATESTKNIIDDLLVSFTRATYEFFIHLLNGYECNKENDGWTPVPASTMTEVWGRDKVEWGSLIEAGLIEVLVLDKIELANGFVLEQTYSRYKGLCRCYRVKIDVVDVIYETFPKTIEEATNAKWYNLMKNQADKVGTTSVLTDDTNNSIPVLLKEAIQSIRRCPFNYTSLKNYIDNFDSATTFGGTDKDRRRFQNDKRCFTKMLETTTHLENGLAEYRPAFEKQMSGRLTELLGCLQTGTKEMKQAAFEGVEGVRNYDLKSSQVNGLIQWFELANIPSIDTTWLKKYLKCDKREYADQVGVEVGVWKSCFLALIMGASLVKNPTKDDFVKPDLAIMNYLLEAAGEDEEVALQYYVNFFALVAPLKKSIDAWQKWLIEKHIPTVANYANGKQTVINKTGVVFRLHEYKTPEGKWTDLNTLKRRLSAFFLQGNEAAFIHHLTCVSKHYGYEVVSNAHDGIVTIGEVPIEAIDYAKEASGLVYAQLEEKPFCD